ncbi:class I SAM-dependent methyltransferase [Phyllobacterium sp. SYP-B3895]|uniref:class I SAM-dependent methyltransferase n=1 Tax=Phyllobacterium sp. SYP-B3895 TaxID=2663240 RepID=UPI001FEDC35B|nr:class I SAM-dependent methyltransferase [Phyllobacterium sp. SYP-B3895]
MNSLTCAVCGGRSFSHSKVLWDELVAEWGLNLHERDYIDRQQGTVCERCGCNIRSIALADAIKAHWSFTGNFKNFVREHSDLDVLEINEASGLTRWLSEMPNRHLAEYPQIDMQQMAIPDASFDLVVHSDTLEHVPAPILALSECKRVLRDEGLLAFTVPIIVDRLTLSRVGLKKSYHGSSENRSADFLVHTEYGANAWQQLIEAGFSSIQIHTFDYPAGIAMSASKRSTVKRTKTLKFWKKPWFDQRR